MQKFFDRLFFILYTALFFLTPLIMFSKTSELFEFNKLLFIYSIALTVLVSWIVKIIVYKKFIFKKTILDIPLILFLVSQILSTIFSIDHHTSLFGYYGRFNGGLVSIFAYVILYFGFVSNFNTKYLYKLLIASLLSAICVFLWGLPGRFGHDLSCLVFAGSFDNACWTDQFRPSERMFSTLGQPNWLGAYFVIFFFISAYFVIKSFTNKDKTSKGTALNIAYATLPPLFFIGTLFTRSRSALLALGIGAVLFFGHIICLSFFHSEFKNSILKHSKKIAFIFLAFLLAILIFKTGIQQIDSHLVLNNKSQVISNPVFDDISPGSGVTESFDIRKIVWQGAIQLGFKYPIFGTGVETFGYAYNFTRPTAHNLTSEWDYIYNKAHNEYLNYFATTGFVGLITYLLVILVFTVWVLIRLFKQPVEGKTRIENIFTSASFIAWLTILITNFFGFSTTITSLFFYLIPAFLIVSHMKETEEKKNIDNLTRKQWAFLCLPAIIFMIGIWSIISYFRADIYYAQGNSLYQAQDYLNSYQYLSKAESLKPDHVYEDRLSVILANLAILSIYQNTNDTKQAQSGFSSFFKMSNYYISEAIQKSPKNFYYYRDKAKNYYAFYTVTSNEDIFKIGIDSLHQAETLAPTDPKNFYTEALFYLVKIDEKNSDKEALQKEIISALYKSITLKPNYRDAHYALATFYVKIGDNVNAKKEYEEVLKIVPQDTDAMKGLKEL